MASSLRPGPPPSRLDADRCYRIACSRDGRFDGTFVTAVLTTGIYCRPSCPAITPRRRNVRFYPTPAAAQDEGFRACKRCRPDAAPGSPEWDARGDVVARAVRLIGDGLVEREGVAGVARRVGYSSRHLTRLLVAEVGTGPLRLAMAHRVQAARTLLETTALPVTEVAWAAGFGSLRQFNDLFRRVYASTPTEVRLRSGAQARRDPGSGGPRPGPGPRPAVVRARLAFRPPLDLVALLSFLGARAVPGVESFDGRVFSTAMRLPNGFGVASVAAPQPRAGRVPTFVECELRLMDVRDYATAVSRLRRLLDLDADPEAVAGVLGADPLLARLVDAGPGRRMPGTVDPGELALRAVVGQQVSVASARAVNGRLAARFGEPLPFTHRGVDRAFPSPGALAGADPAALPLPGRRATALGHLAAAVAAGTIVLHPGTDRDGAEAALLALPGVGPWTAAYIRMRALGDPDVLPPGDVAVERALAGLDGAADQRRWRPWRSYATAHLWAAPPPPPGGGQ